MTFDDAVHELFQAPHAAFVTERKRLAGELKEGQELEVKVLAIEEGTGKKILDPSTIPLDIHAERIDPVGSYAIQIRWSDGHDTGLYSWRYLYELCQNQEARWQEYLTRLDKAGANRDPDVQVVKFSL